MTADEALYDIREQTGNPAHASVDDVVDLVLTRTENPRTDHQDAHFDEAMAAAIDRYGTGTVRTVIHASSSSTTRSVLPRLTSRCVTSMAFGSARQPAGSFGS